MADNVVDIQLKANIDTTDVQKEMSKVASDTSRKAADVLGNFMDNITKNIKDVGSAMSKLDSFKDMDIFSKANAAVEKLKDTNGLDITNEKLLTLEKSLMHVSNEILKLQSGFEHVYATTQKRVDLESKFGDLAGLENQIRTLQTETKDLWDNITKESEPKLSIVGTMDTWYNTIEKLRSALSSLQNTRNMILARDDGTEEWQKDLQEINQEIVEVTSHLGNASKAFYRLGRSSGFGQTKQDIMDTYQKLAVYIDKMRELQELTEARSDVFSAKQSVAGSDIITKFSGLVNTFNELEREINQINNGLDQAGSNAQRLGSATNSAHVSMSKLRNAVWSVSRVLGNVYTLGLDVVRGAKTIANFYNRIWNVAKKVLSVFKQLKDKIKGTVSEHTKSWKQMLKDVLRYSLGIRSLFALFRRLRKYIKEAFEAMAEQIPEVNQKLSDIKSSFNMLKGSLATALEPIISAITPALVRLINLFATLLTYVGMFFAALTGRGYVYKANKSMTSFADATGSAADNAKELNKQLQGFDELNNLTTKENKDSGGGAGPLANFEKVDIPDWIKNLADKIKDIFNQIMEPIKRAWEKVGDYVIGAWKHALYSLRDLLADVGRDFLRAWAERAEQIFINIFNIVGDIGHAIGYIADALRRAWNYNENGYKIWLAILDIIERITHWMREISLDFVKWTRDLNVTPTMTAFREWLESLVPVADAVGSILYDFWHDTIKPILTWTFDGENSGVARLFNIFRDFNKKVNWNKLRENLDKIWQALGRFGQTVGDGLLLFMERMSEYLADWINSDDFTQTMEDISAFLDNITPEEIADDLEQVLTIIKNIADAVWEAISYVVKHKDEILDFLEFLSNHLSTIAGLAVFGKLAIDISRFAANLFLMNTAITTATSEGGGISLLTNSFGSLSGILGKVIGGLAAIPAPVLIAVAVIGTLVAAFIYLYNTSEEFRDRVSKSMQEVKDAFENFKNDMQPFVEEFKIAFASMKEVLKPVLDAIIAFLEAVLSGLLAALGPIVSAIGNVITIITYAITAFLSLLTGDFTGFFTNLSSGVEATVDLVKNIILTFISFGEGAFSTFSNNIAAILTDMKNTVILIFESIKNGIHNIVNDMLSNIESFCNGIVGGIDKAISTVNKLPNVNIPFMSKISIPKLAQGAVIPPNNEFLAVLGDQKRGTNIESPLSTMVEAFNMANKGGNEQELALLQEQNELLRQLLQKEFGISEDAIFKSVRNQNKIYKNSTGVSAFA